MTVTILQYGAGNVQSLRFALQRIGVEALWTDDLEAIRRSERLIIPGVGAAAPAMEYLKEKGLPEVLCSLSQPVLGICLGLQLFCSRSEEEDTECLGIFPVECKRFRTPRKIPHMGWNSLEKLRSPLFRDVREGESVYFVHSYRAESHEDYTIAETVHGERFSAALQRDNFVATQFHPEKSGSVGEKILRSFVGS